jgi:hypothetical protein
MTVTTTEPATPATPHAPPPPPPKRWLGRRIAGAGFRLVRGGVRRLTELVFSSARVLRNLTHRLLLKSDRKRWSDLGNFEAWWDARTEKIARLVPPWSRVIEFGAGRRQLEKRLDPTCTYVPSDLADRGPGTFVCDLNARPLPDLAPLGVDTAVFGGVLEYLHDLDSIAAWLGAHVQTCVASYSCVPEASGIGARLRDRFERYYYGYMNAHGEETIVALFARAGFRCIARDPWTNQRVFLFVKEPPNSSAAGARA